MHRFLEKSWSGNTTLFDFGWSTMVKSQPALAEHPLMGAAMGRRSIKVVALP